MPQLKPLGSTMDLAEVQSLHDHPTLRPLYAQRTALRRTHTTVSLAEQARQPRRCMPRVSAHLVPSSDESAP